MSKSSVVPTVVRKKKRMTYNRAFSLARRLCSDEGYPKGICVYTGPFSRSSRSYFRIPFYRCTLKEVAHPRRAKTRTKSHFAVMRYVTLPYEGRFCVADLISREDSSAVVRLDERRVKTARWISRRKSFAALVTRTERNWLKRIKNSPRELI